MKLYSILWRDPTSESRWLSTEDIAKWGKDTYAETCTTTGYITNRTKSYLVVSASKNSLGDFGDHTIIPRALIVKIKEVR